MLFKTVARCVNGCEMAKFGEAIPRSSATSSNYDHDLGYIDYMFNRYKCLNIVMNLHQFTRC